MAKVTEEQLAVIVGEQVKLSFEELMKDIKPELMEELNGKLKEIDEKVENKLKGEKVNLEDGKGEADTKNKFDSFGEQLIHVARAAAPGGMKDPRLIWHSFKNEKDAASGSNLLVGAEGGFLVAPEYSTELIKLTHEVAIVAKDCRHLPIAGNRIILNALKEVSRANGSRWGGLYAYWVSEAGTATKSKPEFRQIDLKLNKLMGIHYSTEELLEDSVALESIVRQGFGDEFAFLIDDAIIDGSGAGKPRGILSCNALITASKVDEQDAATFVSDNVWAMWNAMPAKNRTKANWYIIQDLEQHIQKLNLKIGTGGIPLFLPPGQGIKVAPSGNLLGRPVKPIEQCKTLGSVGDVIFADLQEYILIEKAGAGIKAGASVHVRFIYDEMTYKFTYRIDGQPIWDDTLTAYNSSVERSPYVVLEART